MRVGLVVLMIMGLGGAPASFADDLLVQQAISIPDVNAGSFSLPPDIKVNDERLAELAKNIQDRNIPILNLADHQEITDDSLKAFKNSSGLKELNLHGTGIHDDGMM